jgi:hypothetical protein
MPHPDDLDLGTLVIRRRTVAKGLDGILDACVEMEGARDPKRMMEMLGQMGGMAREALGTDGDLEEMAEMLDSPEFAGVLEQQEKANFLKMKTGVWAIVDSVVRWVEGDPHCDIRPDQPSSRVDLMAHFEKRVGEWMELDRPELMFAVRAHQARRRLDDLRLERMRTWDFWGTAMYLLDGPLSV